LFPLGRERRGASARPAGKPRSPQNGRLAVAAAVDVDVSGPDRHAGAEASPETPYLSNGHAITVLKNRNPPGCLEIFDFIGDRTP
jgi:hypothetical protein